MICISLWQPWASALFAPRPDGGPLAIKPDETRSWPLPDRLIGKEIGIHAAKRDTRDEREFWEDVVEGDETYERAFAAIGIRSYVDLPRGCIIGSAIFASPVRTHLAKPDDMARDWGNHLPGRWSWPTVNRKLYTTPIPCIGRQGFFPFPETGAHGVTESPAVQMPEKRESVADENPAARGLLFNL